MKHKMRLTITILLLTIVGALLAQECWNVELKGQTMLSGLNNIYHMEALGNYLYVLNSGEEFCIIDVSDPENLEMCGCVFLETTGTQFTISGDHAYLPAYDRGLCVVDISDPYHPEIISYCQTVESAKQVLVNGNYAYVNTWSNFRIIDISNPVSPFFLGECQLDYPTTSLVQYENYVYAMPAWGNIPVVDVSDPLLPEVRAIIDTLGYGERMEIVGDYGICFARNRLHVRDLNDPLQPDEVSCLDLSYWCYELTTCGDYAYVLTWEGLCVIDISNLEQLELVFFSSMNHVMAAFAVWETTSFVWMSIGEL